ncbi:MAG TPA: acyl-CoA dehydrogenase family protein [Vitreimonas sp.]|uniref:acyl-CoA dehydrogenase family protein n=1 Tax=Vitreimonas sp. TaxID=3069702 RepID=UPI002D240D40|nr:acyl-CoA dehydrogenase family protein [Vitreimonas sp.]HYD87057.1 acyl-CoA dehydrogenase family protein [Vitreimonas sp.]
MSVELLTQLENAAAAAAAYADRAKAAVRPLVSAGGKIDRLAIDREQHLVHGLAWVATYAETLREVRDWAAALTRRDAFGGTEQLLAHLLAAEYGAQLAGGVPMTQVEMVRPADFGVEPPPVTLHITQAEKTRLAALLHEAQGRATFEDVNLDEDLDLIRTQFRKFADDRIVPYAHEWHCKDEFIPLRVVEEMGALGVFGLTIPEEFGGSGLGKTAMCVVSEELSRAWIGTGSLGTRSEIAAELILIGGTPEQKAEWLPKIASAEILPTAVFTEPNTGSDLGSLRTRAVREGDHYVVTGNKTWITHAARADMMTLLVRTDPSTTGFNGLSMLLAPKQRGDDADPFPTPGMSGGEIEVIGYRGMKEYEIGFDGFKVPAANLLGGVEGQGFKQLMATFESARIQTAARAVGVAQSALELGLKYAIERKQFGQEIFHFPRVSNKLVMIAAELMAVRQLTYFSARRKDSGKRCDLEAGMAKLLAARVAWAAADNALQIHGGNGFAVEYPISRVLADARILNIFEGAGEIQAMVIGRRLLEEGVN